MASLADRIITALERRFQGYGHFPSEGHWGGLRAIAHELQEQATGTATRDFAYSALPTGMGKTSLLIEAVRILTTDRAYEHVGVVIFTNTLAQIPTLIQEMGLQPSQFAVQTGQANVELNTKGRGEWREIKRGPRKGERVWEPDIGGAQVLFTTQQKLLHVARYRHDFETVWLYRGEPRRVRVWDEAIMPADPLVYTVPQIVTFADKVIALGGEQAGELLRKWALTLPVQAKASWFSKAAYFLFEFSMNTLNKAEAEFPDGSEEDELLGLSGREIRLRPPDKSRGTTAITYREILPENLAPLLILDASGSLRLTYKAWQECRGGLRELPSPGKTYRNLKLFH